MACISAPEFNEWMAYAELEPFGEDVASWRAGLVAATIANVNRDAKKRPSPYQPSDFMPEEPKTPQEQQKDLQDRINAMMMSFGGKTKPRVRPKE